MQAEQSAAASGGASFASAPQVRPQACSHFEARQASSAAGIPAAVGTGLSIVHRERHCAPPLQAARQLSRALQAGDSAHKAASGQHSASAQARHESLKGMPQAATPCDSSRSWDGMPRMFPHASVNQTTIRSRDCRTSAWNHRKPRGSCAMPGFAMAAMAAMAATAQRILNGGAFSL